MRLGDNGKPMLPHYSAFSFLTIDYLKVHVGKSDRLKANVLLSIIGNSNQLTKQKQNLNISRNELNEIFDTLKGRENSNFSNSTTSF